VLHVSLGGFHQVGNQIVAARQLHIDLGERILIGVAAADQSVVDGNEKEDDQDNDAQNDPAHRAKPPAAPCRLWARAYRNSERGGGRIGE
jgi:hypothetical protein